MKRKSKISNVLSKKLHKNEIYLALGISTIILLIILNSIYPLGAMAKSISYYFYPKVQLLPQNSLPAREPKFDYSYAGTLAEKRLKDPDARIVFSQAVNKNDSKGTTWISNMDGTNVTMLDLPGAENQPLNKITYGWILSAHKQGEIVATNYKTGKVRYISVPQVPGYKATIFGKYLSPDMNYLTFKVSYITDYCDKNGHQSGCETFMEVPGGKSGVYSYNFESGKRIYLGNLDYTTYTNKPRWDEFEDGMYAMLEGHWVKVDLETGIKIKVDKLPNDISNTDNVSPNGKMALSFRELNHAKKVKGTIILVDLATKKTKDLIEVSGDYSVVCSDWVSNTQILCELWDSVYFGGGKHRFIMDIVTGEKKTIVPGDSLEVLETAQ